MVGGHEVETDLAGAAISRAPAAWLCLSDEHAVLGAVDGRGEPTRQLHEAWRMAWASGPKTFNLVPPPTGCQRGG